MKKVFTAMTTKATLCLIPLLILASAQAATLTIQPYDYFSTASGFSDGDISVFAGKARWSGVTDYLSTGTHSGTFGDGTVLDYRFVGTDRGAGVMEEHANGGGTYLTSPFTVGTYGTSGGANSGLDVWTTTDPDDVGTWDTTPNSNSWGNDHVTGGDQLRGVIDVSLLQSAQIYFIYGSYKNAATIGLGTTVAGTDLGTLSLPFDGPDNDRLVIQEVTIADNLGDYGTINFNYSAQANAGRGRFSGVIVDGVLIPELEWDAGVDASWNSSNWETGLPATNNTMTINRDGVVVTLDGAQQNGPAVAVNVGVDFFGVDSGNASTLVIDSPYALSAITDVTVGSASTLTVNGTLAADSVAVDGIVGGTGTIDGDLTLGDGATLSVVDIINPLTVNGNITFDNFSLADLDLSGVGTLGPGVYTLIASSDVIDYTGSNWGIGDMGTLFGKGAYFQEGSFELVIIPEPSTAILAGLGLVSLGLRRRRR